MPDSVVASATAVLVNDPELLLIVTVPVSPLTSFAEIVVGEIARFVVQYSTVPFGTLVVVTVYVNAEYVVSSPTLGYPTRPLSCVMLYVGV